MIRTIHRYERLGLFMLLTLIFALMLTYTSLVLPNTLIASERACDDVEVGKSELHHSPLSQFRVTADVKGLANLGAEASEQTIRAKDERIAELERQLSQVKIQLKTKEQDQEPILDWAEDGLRPLRVTVAHHPHHDMLGSFTMPSVLLLAITHRWGWEMELLPYGGSSGQKWLSWAFANRYEHKNGTGSGIQDVNYRVDYNPADLNAQASEKLGLFPDQPFPVANISEWTVVEPLPAPGSVSLHNACRKNPIIEANGYVRCRLLLPEFSDTGLFQKHIEAHGKLEHFLNPEFRQLLRERFMKVNAHRLKYYTTNSTSYNVAIHVRRGDVNKKEYPDRWTEQSVYATIARHICKTHPSANIHIFSSGKNEEGWKTLEQVAGVCGSVSFHLDDYEFDVWAHLVAADALVTSRSTFSYVPALMSGGEVYAPEWGHAPLKHWHAFNNENGELKQS